MIRKQIETVASLKPEKGEIFVIIDGQRYFLAACNITIDVKKQSTQVNTIGTLNAQYKNTFATLVFCVDLEHSANCTAENVEQAENYEIVCEFPTGINESEKIKLDKFVSADVDFFANEWVFEIADQNTIRNLLRFA